MPNSTSEEGKEAGAGGFSAYELSRCNAAVAADPCTPSETVWQTVNSSGQNYYTDTGLSDTQRYCYKMRIKDSNADGSDYSRWQTKDTNNSNVCVVPGSGESSLTKRVQIANLAAPDAKRFTTQATIEWDTQSAADNSPLLADSTVWWAPDNNGVPGNWTSFFSDTQYEHHSIAIPNKQLTPNTKYYYYVVSTTQWNSTDTEPAAGPYPYFTTRNGPTITSIQYKNLANTSVDITWHTNTVNGKDSTSFLEYSPSVVNGALVTPLTGSCDGGYVSDHTCHLGNLTAGLTYYYYVKSVLDGDDQAYAIDNNAGNYYQLTTTTDSTPPTINPATNPILKTDKEAAFSWTTSELAKSWLIYDSAPHTAYSNFSTTSFDPTDTGHNPYSSYKPSQSGTDYNSTHVVSILNPNYLTPDTTYYYRLVSQDTSGNVAVTAEGSFTTLDTLSEHQDLTDPGDPVVSQYSDTEAVVYLPAANTDATSRLCYGEDAIDADDIDSGTGTCALHVDIVTGTKSHFYHLTGLTADTTYHLMTRIVDTQNAEKVFTSNDVSFDTQKVQLDQHEPLNDISLPTVPLKTYNSAVAEWTTDQPADSSVACSLTHNGSRTILFAPDTSLNTKHHIILGGLTSNTDYYCVATSVDDLHYSKTSEEFTFKTDKLASLDHDPLDDITNISESSLTDESIVISFKTVTATDDNLAAQCTVSYGETIGDFSAGQKAEDNFNEEHAIELTGLANFQDYYYKIDCVDNLDTQITKDNDGDGYHFQTLKTQVDQHEPLDTIDPTSIISTPASGAVVIEFNTIDAQTNLVPAQCVIEYKAQGQNYDPLVTVSEDDGYNQSHQMQITGLNPGSLYYYTISCEDDLLATAQSAEQSFNTTKEPTGDVDGPKISGVGTSAITGESVTVSWKTDEDANSLVKYGIISSNNNEDYYIAGNALVNLSLENYITDHEVIINSLTPDTKYYYTVISTDAYGNISESDESSFTTSANSSLSGIDFTSTKLGEVTVTWTTSEKTTSVVDYGISELYSDTKETNSMTNDHEITISNLIQNTVYHFRVGGKDQDNNLYSSGDYKFTPKSPPAISNINETGNQEHETTINFTTDTATDSLITYQPASAEASASQAGSQGNPALTTTHSITLKNLKAGTTYSYTIKVTDLDGNSATYPDPSSTSGQSLRFTTGLDENPPKIDQVRTDSALAQGDRVQTIISWITDEPATTELIYREGVKGEDKEVTVSKNLTVNHIAVITTFKPGTVYYFNARSIDASENIAKSSDFALLTPKRKENIIQIIISNFQDIFGWAKF